MKLSQVNYESELPKAVEITNHLGQSFEKKAFVTVHAWKSRIGNKVMIEMQREMIDLRMQKVEADKEKETDAEIEAIGRKALGRLVTGWSGIEDENGKALKFTPDNVDAVLSNSYIMGIVDTFASSLGNFKG